MGIGGDGLQACLALQDLRLLQAGLSTGHPQRLRRLDIAHGHQGRTVDSNERQQALNIPMGRQATNRKLLGVLPHQV
jgi:hypothetical protein